MKSQSTNARISQPWLTLALGLSDRGFAERERLLCIRQGVLLLEGFAERERLLCLRQGIPRHSVWVK